MTDTLLDPNDTGEIKRIPGEDRTVVLRTDVGEATQNIAGWDAGLPPRLRRPAAEAAPDETLVFTGWPTGAEVVAADKEVTGSRLYVPEALRPAAPNPGPLPPTPVEPKPNPPAPRPSVPPSAARWELIADTDRVSLLAALGGEPDKRRTVRYQLPSDRRPWDGPRHAAPAPAWTKWAIGIGTLAVLWSVVTLAVIL